MATKETNLRNRVMVDVAQFGTMFRNNVGVAIFKKCNCPEISRVRYGLITGASDLVGWVPVTIQPEHVGSTVAVFAAIETKGDGRATDEQLIFSNNLANDGGIAIITADRNYASKILGQIKRCERPWGQLYSEMSCARRSP